MKPTILHKLTHDTILCSEPEHLTPHYRKTGRMTRQIYVTQRTMYNAVVDVDCHDIPDELYVKFYTVDEKPVLVAQLLTANVYDDIFEACVKAERSGASAKIMREVSARWRAINDAMRMHGVRLMTTF